MAGPAIVIILCGMAGGWLFRSFLLLRLRRRHPGEFAALGQPSIRLLASLVPRHQDTQIGFWRYLLSGKAFRLGDPLLSACTAVALASDFAMVCGVGLLLWSLRAHA
jgi:hypothetical protein